LDRTRLDQKPSRETTGQQVWHQIALYGLVEIVHRKPSRGGIEMSAPPKNENAAPANRDGGFGKQPDNATPPATAQESAALALTKNWLRADSVARRNFLRDVRAGMPYLWRAVEAEFSERKARR
jgi:hypothetical protein